MKLLIQFKQQERWTQIYLPTAILTCFSVRFKLWLFHPFGQIGSGIEDTWFSVSVCKEPKMFMFLMGKKMFSMAQKEVFHLVFSTFIIESLRSRFILCIPVFTMSSVIWCTFINDQ